MAITTAGAYLIIARYNRGKWNELGAEQEEAHETAEILFPEKRYPVGQLTDKERTDLQVLTAEESDELRQLEERTSPQQLTLGERTWQDLTLEERAARLELSAEEFEEKLERIEALKPRSPAEIEQGLEKLKGVRLLHTFHTRAFVEIDKTVLATKQPAPIKLLAQKTEDDQRREVDALLIAPDTDENDPGMGWIAVVDHYNFTDFVIAMGGKAGPLWRMYDIEVIPLNNDQSTKDIYDFMTPVSWRK